MSDYYIPTHLIAHVLLRLPFDSLMRFRCVSRSWRDLIDSPFFTQMHSKRSQQLFIKQNPHPPGSKIVVLKGTVFYTFDSVSKLGNGSFKAINARELKGPPLEFRGLGLYFVGSSNGILCLWNFWTDELVLWNPWIQKSSALPSPPYEYTMECRSSIHAAFGYDHVNDDYKVVKWYVYADQNVSSNILPSCRRYGLCVYSLKLNSWRRIKGSLSFELPDHHLFFPRDCAVLNGALHWLMTTRVEYFIVAFDLGSEEFLKMSCDPYPQNPQYTYGTHQELCVLNGCVSLLCYNYSPKEKGRGVDVWMIEDYGVVASSWTKLTRIDFPHHLRIQDFKPLAFSKKRRKMLLQIGWEKLVLYDIDTKSFRDVAIGTTGDAKYCFPSCICVGSFVSPCS